MRRPSFAIVFVLLSLLSGANAYAQESGERVQLRDGRVSFVPPAGFKPMSKEDINVKFGRKGEVHAPDYAYGNERQNVSVAVGFRGSGLQEALLDELKKIMVAQFESSIPGIEWIEREIITREGRRWLRLHFKAKAIDTGIINDMYFTIFDGQLLLFNFNSTIAQYENYKESLRRSAQSINVK
ncbi:MAG TPA: hypothetical protein VEY11_03640 [Pyrinomonadaceae bacterium]|nr:hypothetical protein [Pyrinomonadaceae bacterium]